MGKQLERQQTGLDKDTDAKPSSKQHRKSTERKKEREWTPALAIRRLVVPLSSVVCRLRDEVGHLLRQAVSRTFFLLRVETSGTD